MRKLLGVLLICLCIAAWAQSEAQESSDGTVAKTGNTEGDSGQNGYGLPETVVTGSGESLHTSTTSTGSLVPADPAELPLTVEIVPEELIEDRYTTSFYESLQYVSGVFTGGHSSFTVSSGRPTIRGFSGSDVMLNGVVLPNRMPMFLDTVGISGIEFYKGPLNSALGGQSGLQGSGGAVNILSKMPDFSGLSQRLTIGGTANDGWSGRLTYDPNFVLSDAFALRIPMAYTYDEPFYLPDDIDGGQNAFLAPTAIWKLSQDTVVTIAATYQNYERPAYQGIPYLKGEFLVPLDTYYGDDNSRDEYTGTTFGFRVDHDINENTNLSFGAGYARADEEREHWSVSPNAPRGSTMTTMQYYDQIIATHSAFYSYTKGDYLDEYYNAFIHLNHDIEIGSALHQLTFGTDWLKRRTTGGSTMGTTGWMSLDNPTLVTPTLTPFIESESEVERYGLILQDFITWKQWRFLVGGRADRHESDTGNDADSYSPRVGVTYMIQPDCAIYGNYTLAEGPNFGYDDINGEELTDSWRSTQIEAGVRKRLFDNLWASAGVFEITQKDTPETDPLDPSGTSYILAGENKSQGLEASLSGEFTENWNWWGSYTHLTYEDVDDNIDFTRYPKNTLALWTSYRIPSGSLEGLRAGVGYRYTSETTTTFRGAYVSDEYTIDSYSVVDVAFDYPLKGLSNDAIDTTLRFGVKNVFDEEYVESNRHGTENFPGDPRTFWIELSAAF